MHHHHGHHKQNSSIQKNIVFSIVLNSLIVAGEIIAGIFSNSFALISDALHNFSDLLTLILSLAAVRISSWKATPNKSYGYLRAEIIAAFINSSALVIIGAYIIYQAAGRLFTHEKITASWVIAAASIAFLANGVSTYLLSKNSKEDINAKSAYLHLFYDSVNSLLVIISGVAIYLFNWTIIDPLLSMIIGIFIIKSGWDVVLETVNILIEGTPKNIDMQSVTAFITSFPEVKEIHHLHIWSLSSKMKALSVHVVVSDQLVSQGYLIIDKIEKALKEKFDIDHPTIQLEADLSHEQNGLINISRNK
jgi:cobalt-zinc-cadmium efflux system protein